jgi:hypothetical protein
MKPSNPSNNRQFEFRRLNCVTLSIWWCLSRSEPYPFMISVEIKPGLVERNKIPPRTALLLLKDRQELFRVSDSDSLLLFRQERRDPTKMADQKAQ